MIKKPHHYYCELYGFNVYYFLGWSKEEFIIYASKNYSYNGNMEGCNGRTLELIRNDNGSCDYVIWTKDLNSNHVLSHEAVHVAFFALNARGIDVRDSCAEAMAYVVEAIVRNSKPKKVK